MRMNISSLFTQFRKLSFVHFIHNNLNHVVNSSENGQTHKDDWIDTHHHTKYTKHHTERETTISSQLLLVMAGSVFHFDSHRAALYIHFYLHTYMTQKNWKNAYVFWILKTKLVKIKSAQYHAKGYEYHFPI